MYKTLLVELTIFTNHFRDLRCLRNTIHTNLMITYLLTDVTWILVATLQSNTNITAAKVSFFIIIIYNITVIFYKFTGIILESYSTGIYWNHIVSRHKRCISFNYTCLKERCEIEIVFLIIL